MKQVLLLGREERLDILRRAFGLEQYRFARRNVEEHLVRSVIAPRREVYGAEAQALPATEEEERQLGDEADRLAEEREGVEAAIALIEAGRARLAEQAAPLAGARAAFDRAEGELIALERVIVADEAEVAALRSDLDRSTVEVSDDGDESRFAALSEGYARWEALGAERSRLRGAAAEHRALEEEMRTLEAAIARERERLEGRQEALRAQLATGDPTPVLAALAAETVRVEAEESRLEAELAPEAEVAEETGLCNQIRGTAQARVEAAEHEAERVIAEAEALAAIGDGAACPTCRQTLTAEHLAAIAADAEAEAELARAGAGELRGRLAAIDQELARLGEQRLLFERVRHDLVAIRAERARLEGRRRELEQRRDRAGRRRRRVRRALPAGSEPATSPGTSRGGSPRRQFAATPALPRHPAMPRSRPPPPRSRPRAWSRRTGTRSPVARPARRQPAAGPTRRPRSRPSGSGSRLGRLKPGNGGNSSRPSRTRSITSPRSRSRSRRRPSGPPRPGGNG